jgi:hypothetical protein
VVPEDEMASWSFAAFLNHANIFNIFAVEVRWRCGGIGGDGFGLGGVYRRGRNVVGETGRGQT